MGEPIEGGQPAHDPYQPPHADVGYTEHDLYQQDSARAAVGTPAIFLAVLSGLHVLLVMCGLGSNLLMLTGVIPRQDFSQLPPEMEQWRPMLEAMNNPATAVVQNLIGLVVGGVILAGSLQMRSLSSYGLAMAAAILAIIPCTSPCCCLIGMPIGIWALTVLMRPEVKAAFGAGKG